MLQEDGAELAAFAYVWGEEFREGLSDEPWSFSDFLANDFNTFWQEEMQDEVGTS